MQVAAEDEESQKRGIVAIIINWGPRRGGFDPYAAWKVPHLSTTLPLRINAVHYVYQSSMVVPIIATTMFMAGQFVRARFRQHSGTCFGIFVFLFYVCRESVGV